MKNLEAQEKVVAALWEFGRAAKEMPAITPFAVTQPGVKYGVRLPFPAIERALAQIMAAFDTDVTEIQ